MAKPPQPLETTAPVAGELHEESLRQDALKERVKNLEEQIAKAKEHKNEGLAKIYQLHLDDLKKELK